MKYYPRPIQQTDAKPGDAVFNHVKNQVIATARQSLNAAAQYFHSMGIHSLILGDTVTGEAREIAKSYAALAREIRLHPQQNIKAPIALLSGGETSVTIKGHGRGGRNTEFLSCIDCARWNRKCLCISLRYGWNRWERR